MTKTMSANMGSGDHIKAGETIHSGQFMVSNLEVDGQEEDDDEDIGMREDDCDKPEIVDTVINNIIATNSPNYTPAMIAAASVSIVPKARELQRYNPIHLQIQNKHASSSVEIDTDLSTIFNTLNVTYTQKLTSPKWNPFKGIRLRWKEKIRLNNVIWRCWHMQFIMKRKTLVCQFASPLDVDIHNTPQAILLEGKYWKRKCNVIKAEYKKWRRFNVNKALGATVGDTVSELDFLEWSPNNSDLLMVSENMPSDALFSTLSQYPFPDLREITRGAGRADFIQPSLGPLQPNFDDLMELDLDFFNFNTRLAPVPEAEEGSDDFVKAAIDYNYPMTANTATIQEIRADSLQNTQTLNQTNTIQYSGKIFGQNISSQQIVQSQQQQQQQQQQQDPTNVLDTFIAQQNLVPISSPQVPSTANTVDDLTKDGKIKYTRGYSKIIGRREPHNYEKCQPTTHQTMAYNLMISQPQSSQNVLPNQYSTNTFSNVPSMVPSQNSAIMTNPVNLSSSNSNTNINNNTILVPNLNATKILTQSVSLPLTNQTPPPKPQPRSNSTPTTNYTSLLQAQQHSPPNLQSLQQQPAQDTYNKSTHSPSPNSYKVYHNQQQPYKIPSQNSGYNTPRSLRHTSPTHNPTLTSSTSNLAETQQQLPPHPTKEMIRSNSLPINAVFPLPPKDETFVVPKYQAKTNRMRSRSNSMIIKQQNLLPVLHATTSEPMLNASNSALLAQLLTTNTASSFMTKQPSISSSSAINVITKQITQQPMFQFPPQSASTSVQIQLGHQQAASGHIASNSSLSSSSGNQSVLSFASSVNHSLSSQSLSPESVIDADDPMSPGRSSAQSKHPRENQRRAGHIHAEQKRRYNIKNGFDMLHSLIPQLQQNPNAKLSKAAMLQKGAEYIKQLRNERAVTNEKMDALRKEIDALNNSLSNLQTALPANGAPVSRQRTGRVKDLYNEYVRYRTLENWKFWIFGLIFEPLMNSFNQTVSVASMDEMCRTSMLWVDQHCSLVELRPAVSNKLRHLSTTTDILSDPPTSLQEEVLKAISNTCGSSNSGCGSSSSSNQML